MFNKLNVYFKILIFNCLCKKLKKHMLIQFDLVIK
jgi:hypothetical protein